MSGVANGAPSKPSRPKADTTGRRPDVLALAALIELTNTTSGPTTPGQRRAPTHLDRSPTP